MSKAPSLGLAALFVLLGACGGAPAEPATPSSPAAAGAPAHGATSAATPAAATPSAERPYTVLVTADRVKAMMGDAKTVVVDVRSPEDYAKGHIPGAINLHGELWRTPSAKGGKPSHDLFTKADGSIDTAKYDALLGGAGIANDSKVVVYGNHSGKADGSVPAVVLLALGHKDVMFLDGVGLDQWKAAGQPLSTDAKKLAAATYKSAPANLIVGLDHVKKHVAAKDAVLLDTRSAGEFTGTDPRDNKKAGHIPGAVNVNYEDLLGKDKTTVNAAQARTLLTSKGVTPDKKVVLYCQTGTRASHSVLVLRELGYTNVSLYDGSFQEWGNREDTAVEK